MIEDLKNIEKQIDRLWHDSERVRDEISEYPEDIARGIDLDLRYAADKLAEAEVNIQRAVAKIEVFETIKTAQQDENIAAAIALLESKGFIVGTKT